MHAEADSPFEANVQIGTRFRFIDRNGTAMIDGGRLTLPATSSGCRRAAS
jgi:hypothetical protein